MADQDKSKDRSEQQAGTPSRRAALKKVLVGGAAAGALPTQWTRPVVDAIVLPAHAGTSEVTALPHFRGVFTLSSEAATLQSITLSQAGYRAGDHNFDVCVEVMSDNKVRATVGVKESGDNATIGYGRTETFDYAGGNAGAKELNVEACPLGLGITVELTSFTSSSIVVTFANGTANVFGSTTTSYSRTVSPGTGCPVSACQTAR